MVLAAVSRHGIALKYTAEHLCADREVVLAAVSQDRCAYATEDLRADMEVALPVAARPGFLAKKTYLCR